MEKKIKVFLWGVALLVVLMISVTIYSTISKNYELGTSIIFAVMMFVIIFFTVDVSANIISGISKLNKKKKYITQKKVAKSKPLPIYSRSMQLACITYWITVTFICIASLKLKIIGDGFGMQFIVSVILGAIFFYFKLRQSKMLYLYKDNMNVKSYTDNISDYSEVADLYETIDSPIFLRSKCEQIELYSEVRIFSCFARKRNYSSEEASDDHFSYIFSTVFYNNENGIDIMLNNDILSYLHKENMYFSKYSNLPPFIIANEFSKDICPKIEDVCLKFFTKTRLNYIFTIRYGKIGLGLKSARFGKYNRFFNKDKTVKLTDKAVKEIEEFLITIREIIEHQ